MCGVMLDQMDAGGLQTARSGSDRKIKQVIVIKSMGNQDEDVDIMDDGDPDKTPLAAAGDATASKSAAGNTIAPRVGVDNLVFRRRKKQTASFGRRIEPQLVAGEHGSCKYSDASVPKVSFEGTSKQSDFQKHMSAKNSNLRARLLAIIQQQSKRRALVTESSTSLASDRGYMIGHNNRADESDVPLTMRREFSRLKSKEILQDGEKSPPVTVSCKRQWVLRSHDDDSDEGLFERIAAFNDGVRNPKTSMRAGDNGTGPLRSAFPLDAKRKMHPPEAALATRNADKHSFWQWIICTKCMKIRLVHAEEELDTSSWCCEKNIQNPMYASCLAPQERGDYWKVEERQVSIIESDSLEEVQESPNSSNVLEIERKEKAQRKMVWVKVQVDGKHVWWPGLTVKVVPAAVQKLIDEAADDPGRAVWLFHPPNDLDQYQVVRKSSLRPFFLRAFRNSSSHPEFKVAVAEADQYFAEPDMEESSENFTGTESETSLNADGNFGKCLLNYVPHERAESNELDVDDPHCSQVEADEEIEYVEDGEVNQALAENGELLDASHGDVPDDPHCSPSHGDQMESSQNPRSWSVRFPFAQCPNLRPSPH